MGTRVISIIQRTRLATESNGHDGWWKTYCSCGTEVASRSRDRSCKSQLPGPHHRPKSFLDDSICRLKVDLDRSQANEDCKGFGLHQNVELHSEPDFNTTWPHYLVQIKTLLNYIVQKPRYGRCESIFGDSSDSTYHIRLSFHRRCNRNWLCSTSFAVFQSLRPLWRSHWYRDLAQLR